MAFAGSCERTHWMDAFFRTAHSLFTANTERQPTGSSACHCRGEEHFELQASCTPKLHTVIHIVFELFRNTEANYSWHILLSCYPNPIPHMWNCATSNAPSHKFLKLFEIKVKCWRKRQFGAHTKRNDACLT